MSFMTKTAVALILTTFFVKPSFAGIITGPIVNPGTGNTYYLLTAQTWTDSEAEAILLGGHLVTINDAAENTWVFNTFNSFGGIERALWIGLSDAAM